MNHQHTLYACVVTAYYAFFSRLRASPILLPVIVFLTLVGAHRTTAQIIDGNEQTEFIEELYRRHPSLTKEEYRDEIGSFYMRQLQEYATQQTSPSLSRQRITTRPPISSRQAAASATTSQGLVPDSEEYEALRALYLSTDGDNWHFNDNWLQGNTSADFATWYNVVVRDGDVVKVILNNNNLRGEIPPALGKLKALEELSLVEFYQSSKAGYVLGVIPPELGELTNLKRLTLGGSYAEPGDQGLTGTIPTSFGKLTKLEELFILFTQVSGTIPEEISQLTQLKRLQFYANQLSGIVPGYFKNFTQLESLLLSYNRFTSVSSELASLTQLEYLDLSGNELAGPFPSVLTRLTGLTTLNLAYNEVAGPLPSNLGNLQNLTHLVLHENELDGQLPSSVTQLNRLQFMNLSDNRFSGTIPTSLRNISSFETCYLTDNYYTFKEIEPFFFQTNRSYFTTLRYSPQQEVKLLDSVHVIEKAPLTVPYPAGASRNRYRWQKWVGGSWQDIPGATSRNYTKQRVELSDAGSYRCIVTNQWATQLELTTTLVIVTVEESPLDPQTQAMHDFVNSMTNADARPASWNLSDTIANWEGVVMEDGWVTKVIMPDRYVQGEIPASFENLEKLERLVLTGTGLTGPIPSELGTLTELTHVELGNNDLNGPIPASFSNLVRLEQLNLSQNQLSSSIPNFSRLSVLQSLQLQNNQLTGGIPTSLSGLDSLRTLRLNTNPNLGGPIPEALAQLPVLEKLYLNNSGLTDTIPSILSDLDSLIELNLGGNELDGDIPTTLDSLKKLKKLHLHENNLTYLPDLTQHPNVKELDVQLDGNRLPLADIAYNHTGIDEYPFKKLRYADQQEGVDTVVVTGQVFTLSRDVALRVDLKEHPQHAYQWQKREGGNWANIAGATERSFVIPNATEEDARNNYRAVMTNSWATRTDAYSTELEPEAEDFRHYVRVYTPRKTLTNAGTIDLSTAVADVSVTTNYIDGFGRTAQTVSRGAGGTASQDLVQFNRYDALGRADLAYLPYATSTATGLYRPDALEEQQQFYRGSDDEVVRDSNPFNPVRYEDSPLSRVLEQGAPGEDWQLGAGHTLTTAYTSNFKAYGIAILIMDGTVTYQGSYETGTLWLTITMDENDHDVREYRNRQGQTVLKRVEGTGDTYYVYDLRGRLRMTVPPQAVKQLAGNWDQLNASDFRQTWLFTYDYDDYGRMSEEHVPGGGITKMIYDRWGRLVYTQTAAMREANPTQWTYTKYDYLDRPVMTGVFNAPVNEATLRQQVATATNRYESRTATGAGYTLSNSHPASVGERSIRTVSYYDNYSFPHADDAGMAFTDDLGSRTKRTNMRGELTGSLTRNLSTNEWLASVIYYDEQDRPIVTITENHLGGTDRTTTRYASRVLDEIEETITRHVTSGKDHTIRQVYAYDHQSRPTRMTHRVNDGTAVTLATHAYNALGQLVKKTLNDGASAGQAQQTVDYRYHIRGWLKSINDLNSDDAYFAQELIYERGGDQTVVQYNGNITDQEWKNLGEAVQKYQYKYDAADRLINAVHSGDYSTKSIKYDANGNITDLQRFIPGTTDPQKMDFLQYTYQGNRLKKVKERNGGDKTAGFVDAVDTNDEYGYDASGNLVRDHNKGITSIDYDLVLNLPLEVRMATGTIRYAYDAAGIKLSQTVLDNADNVLKTTHYNGAFEYDGDQLALIHHSEGRVSFSTADRGSRAAYHFDLKDHLGNVRTTFTSEPIIHRTVATMEADSAVAAYEELLFQHLDSTRHLLAFHNTTPISSDSPNPNRVAALNQTKSVGPTRSLKVSKGDKVRLWINARYEEFTPPKSPGNGMIVAGVIESLSPAARGEGVLRAANEGARALASGGAMMSADAGEVPEGSLNFLFLDEDYTPITSQTQVRSISTAARVTDTTMSAVETLYIEVEITQNGYVSAYPSNESATWVYFDDFVVEHETHLVQVQNYYPFGATHDQTSYVSQDGKYRYQGKELQADLGLNLLDFHARQYDPLLGRFTSMDPQNQFASGCVGMGNNPIIGVDPDGKWVHLAIGAAIGGTFNLFTNLDNVDNFGDGLKYFGVGAAAGALAAGTGAGVSAAFAGGSFGAGFVGASAASATGFIAGAATGASAGIVNGLVQGTGNALLGGQNFGDALGAGAGQAWRQGAIGGATGGLFGGLDALSKDVNFFTGKGSFDLSSGYGAHGVANKNQIVKGKYVGKFKGSNVYESSILDAGDGITLPERGIFVSKGAFSRKLDIPLVRHEFGHVLQAREIGVDNFYREIGSRSFVSAATTNTHRSYWTETWANYLSSKYLGISPANWPTTRFPIQNISPQLLRQLKQPRFLNPYLYGF